MDSDSEKIATFFSHYGAMVFKRRMKECILAPVPRTLSSSCGTAAFFKGPFPEELYSENLEAVYSVDGDRYIKLYENEE